MKIELADIGPAYFFFIAELFLYAAEILLILLDLETNLLAFDGLGGDDRSLCSLKGCAEARKLASCSPNDAQAPYRGGADQRS